MFRSYVWSSSPITTEYFILKRSTNGFTSEGVPEASATPITSTPLPLNFLCSSLNSGISDMQGPHQVAQKSTTMTLPFKLSELSGFPSRLCNLRSTIGFKLVFVDAVTPLLTDSADWRGAATAATEATRMNINKRWDRNTM